MKTKEEVQEITVLTDEQIALLSDETKENVIYLTEQIGSKDLMVLNPMVAELVEIREMGSKLKMKPAVDGKFDKSNIQEFTDIKKKIRSFRAGVKTAAKTLKEEPAKITKAIIAIEKTFVNEATVVYDDAEKEFDAYIQEEARIAEEKQKAKDAELLAKVEEANKAAADANNQIAKTNIYNKIKYEIIGEGISEKTSTALASANKNTLVVLSEKLNNTTYEDAIEGLDISILETDVQSELKERFVTVKNQSIQLIKEKVASIDLESENMVLKASSPVSNVIEAKEQIDNVMPPEVPAVPVKITDVDILEKAKELYNMAASMIAENPHCSPLVYDLRNSLSKFK